MQSVMFSHASQWRNYNAHNALYVIYTCAYRCFHASSHVSRCVCMLLCTFSCASMHARISEVIHTCTHIYIYMEWLLKSTHTCTLNPHVYTQFQGYTAYISGMLTAYISGMLACMFVCGMPSHKSMIRSRFPNSETEREREREREIERERERE